MIKKITSVLLALLMLLSFTACNSMPTPTTSPSTDILEPTQTPQITPAPDYPDYPVETLDISNLSEYVIVYPSYYDEYRMYEVNLLRDTIKNVTGSELELISDDENEHEHEIILASSSRENGVEESIEMFESGLD